VGIAVAVIIERIETPHPPPGQLAEIHIHHE
jgi:hypothetical protein